MNTLTLKHIDETEDSTVSGLLLNGNHLCYVIEDGYREQKVFGETRIPAGTYELFPRKSGGFYSRYLKRFGHKFVIGFKHVPNFTFILMHIGNFVANTHGCLLINRDYRKGEDGNFQGIDSTSAYLELHDLLGVLFEDGKVFIEIDRGGNDNVVEPPIVEPPEEEEEPKIAEPKGCVIEPLLILALICFGAAISSL